MEAMVAGQGMDLILEGVLLALADRLEGSVADSTEAIIDAARRNLVALSGKLEEL